MQYNSVSFIFLGNRAKNHTGIHRKSMKKPDGREAETVAVKSPSLP